MAVVTVFRAALLASCVLAVPSAIAADPASAPSSAAARTYSGDPDYAAMQKSVVRVVGQWLEVKTENGQPVMSADGKPVILKGTAKGSGVVVATGPAGYRYIATNVHVIARAMQHNGTISIVKPAIDGKPAELIEVNPIIAPQSANVDLAFLEVQDAYFQPAKVAEAPPPSGQSVAAIGFPDVADKQVGLALTPTLSDGRVAAVVKKSWSGGGGAPFDIIQHGATINPGNSGGGLFDYCGAVVGINTQDTGHRTIQAGDNEIDIAAAPGVYYAIGSTEIAHLAPEKAQIAVASGACKPGAGATVAPPVGNETGGKILPPPAPWWETNKTLLFAGLAALGAIVLGGVAAFALRPKRGKGAPAPAPAVSAATAPPGPRPPVSGGRLVMNGKDGEGAAVKFELARDAVERAAEGVVLGREPPAGGLRLRDDRARALVSREHARFKMKGEHFQIEDARSANSTYLNGEKLKPFEPRPLRTGDKVRFADLEFTIDIV